MNSLSSHLLADMSRSGRQRLQSCPFSSTFMAGCVRHTAFPRRGGGGVFYFIFRVQDRDQLGRLMSAPLEALARLPDGAAFSADTASVRMLARAVKSLVITL